MDAPRIDWLYPSPRKGLPGILDRFIGPGATKTEIVLQFAVPFCATIAAMYHLYRLEASFSLLQYVVCGLLALDITGGIITNSTSSAKRWYHRQGQGLNAHLGFSTLHVLHLVLVSYLFLEGNIIWATTGSFYLVGMSALILCVEPYLQRPIAMIAYSGSLILALYVLQVPTGLEWFLPLFYLKIFVCHLVKEEPYRPKK